MMLGLRRRKLVKRRQMEVRMECVGKDTSLISIKRGTCGDDGHGGDAQNNYMRSSLNILHDFFCY